ncbi:MAG: ribosomal protein S18-alanine N-acetyltransferase [Candidatus Aminicenantes bacterium]|nr:ribosomal protein S18-alanine N-acetyltransferase [Candidatus Aminicenantes bacterium]
MKEGDIPSVLAIEKRSFANPWSMSAFIGEIANKDISYPYVIVHRTGDKVIGYIIYWKIDEEVQISNFALHPDYRGSGVGKKVLQDVLDELHRGGTLYVFLEVRPSNFPARLLYEKMGFEIFGVRKNYYRTPDEDALIMGKTL